MTSNAFSGWKARSLWAKATLILALLIGLFAVSTVLSVNIFPVITNDSLAYIGHSNDLVGFGWVNFGYRQFGYPASLAIDRGIADLVTVEPLLFASVVQRALLLVAGGLAVFVLRWWSIPLLAFLLAADTLSYSNLVLTEGLSLFVAVILGLLMAFLFRVVQEEKDGRRVLVWGLGALVSALSLLLLTLRFPFAVFGIAPGLLVAACWRSSFRRSAMTIFGIYLVLSGALVAMLSTENEEEYGLLFPSVNGERALYWAAWSQVFVVDETNSADAGLKGFYNGGSPYAFITEVDRSGLEYWERQEIYRDAVEELLANADMSPAGSQWEAFIWSLRGGRLDDINGTIKAITTSDRQNVDDVIHSNSFEREEGVAVFAERYNRSQEPGAVLTSQLGQRLPLPSGRGYLKFALPVALVVLLLGLTWRRTRYLSLAGLVVVIVYAAAIGSVRADNYRFLVTTSAFGITCGTAVLASVDWGDIGRRFTATKARE